LPWLFLIQAGALWIIPGSNPHSRNVVGLVFAVRDTPLSYDIDSLMALIYSRTAKNCYLLLARALFSAKVDAEWI
jgi:hypothetical protein